MSLPSLQSYVGLDATTGGTVAGDAHLRQSIRDILTTPIGTRVMRRAYGADLPIDAPMNAGVVADVVAACATAIIDFEPRVRLLQVVATSVAEGQLVPDLVVQLGDDVVTLPGVAA